MVSSESKMLTMALAEVCSTSAMFTDPMLGGAAVVKVADLTSAVNALSRDTCTSYSEIGARPVSTKVCVSPTTDFGEGIIQEIGAEDTMP